MMKVLYEHIEQKAESRTIIFVRKISSFLIKVAAVNNDNIYIHIVLYIYILDVHAYVKYQYLYYFSILNGENVFNRNGNVKEQ